MGGIEFLAGASVLVMPKLGLVLLGGTILIQHLKGGLNKKGSGGDEVSEKGQDQHINEEWELVVQPTCLKWLQLTCTLKKPSQELDQIVLDNISGQAKPRRMLAIMGPSGSGKTTVLGALAGRLPYNPNMHLSGYITVNGHPTTTNHYRQAYVLQEDLFYSQMTARETLELAAKLHLPENISEQSRNRQITNVIQKLGLQKCINTRIGDTKTRGLSGGEKKRLSIACQLLGCPALLLVDEPTTGLDAFQAQQVMESLKQLATEGHTVICSIHQPRSSVFAMFDDLLLLADGKPVYFGAAQEAIAYFEQQGYHCPEHFNPAEFMADLISIDYSSTIKEQQSEERLKKLCSGYKAPDVQFEMQQQDQSYVDATVEATVGLRKQFMLLLQRAWRQIKRDKSTIKLRAGTSIQTAFIFGSVWYRLRKRFSSVPSRLGLLQVVATYIAQTTIFKTLNVFPKEKVIFNRERSQGAYAVAPYLAAKSVAELPLNLLYPVLFGLALYPLTGLSFGGGRFFRFLGICSMDAFDSTSLSLAIGAIAPSTEAALVLGPAISIVFVVFGGLYIKLDDVPLMWRWIPRVSMITRAYEGLVLNEFRGTYFDPEQGEKIAQSCGDEVVNQVGFSELSISDTLLSSVRILAFNYWMTYQILKSQKPKFQSLEEPNVEDYVCT